MLPLSRSWVCPLSGPLVGETAESIAGAVRVKLVLAASVPRPRPRLRLRAATAAKVEAAPIEVDPTSRSRPTPTSPSPSKKGSPETDGPRPSAATYCCALSEISGARSSAVSPAPSATRKRRTYR